MCQSDEFEGRHFKSRVKDRVVLNLGINVSSSTQNLCAW